MRYVAILGFVCLGAASLVIGCSGDDPKTTGGGGDGMSSSSGDGGMGTSSSSSSGTAGGGGMGTSSSSSSSSSSGMVIHNCTQATAADHLNDATTTVLVGGSLPPTYDPPCIRIKKGADVTFSGMFSAHPTVGGLAGPPQAPDSASPIKQTTTGTAVTFTFDTVGTYPYYCEYHAPAMAGVVYVE